MNYMTTREAATSLEITLRTVQNHCKALGFSKAGRDYLLTPGQVNQIRQYMAEHPRGGRKIIKPFSVGVFLPGYDYKKVLATNKKV